jgi:DNA polymerase-1
LLEQFGTIENIFQHIDEVDKKWRKKLHDGENNAILSKKLVALKTDVELGITPEGCKLQRCDNEKLQELFHQLEFKSLMKNIKVTIDPDKYDYHTVLTESELEELIGKLQPVDEFSIDLETTDVDTMRAKIVGISISLKPDEAYYIPVYYELIDRPEMLSEEYVLNKLKPFLEDAKYSKIGHNIKYDLEVLKRSGVDINGIGFDTMIASYLLNPSASGHKLDDVAFKYLQRQMIPIKDLIGIGAKQIPMSQVPVEKVSDYACEDADTTLHLKYILEPQLVEHDLEEIFSNLELPLIPVLADMEMAGVKIDTEFLRKLSIDYEKNLQEMTEQIYELAGGEFNINSPKQLGEVLFDKLKLPKSKKTKTGYSTDENVLNTLARHHELPALILEYREFAKLKSTYTDALIDLINPHTGRLHTSFNQAVTATGRLSSSNPNLQNIPVRTERGREIRRAFIAEGNDKVLLVADYSQIELRILAHLSKDERLVEAFAKDEDIHAYAASLVFGVPVEEVTPAMRSRAKTMNYGIVYGIGAMRLSNELKIDIHEAQAFIDNYFQTYAGVKTYFDRTIQEATKKGYVTTLMGRRRYVPEIHANDRNTREFGKRIAINTPVQGCLPYETRVLTTEGYRPIGELYHEGRSDLQVWTGTAFAPFFALNRGPCELAELELENGYILRCDTRHEVLVVTEEGYLWKQYQDITSEDYICLTLPQEIEFGALRKVNYHYRPGVHNGIPLSIESLDESFFYWLGFYCGDGWLSSSPDRWILAYAFGKKADRYSLEQKVAECANYFESLGLNASVRYPSSNKAEVKIHSRGLVELLEKLGVDRSEIASTKRVPEFVFRSPLAMRKAFLLGVLDADGYAGGRGSSNPNIHLCQRKLLEELWLLFRTVGVEGKLRGPYQHKGKISYRLDLIGGMLGRSLGFSECSSVRIPGMCAPAFIVKAFLQTVSHEQLKQHSHKVLYSRLRHGGVVSIYTLAEMVKAAGAKLSTPLYSFSKLRRKRRLGVVEDTYTLAVNHPSHSFDSEGVISKNTAADLIKVAMLKIADYLESTNKKTRMVLQVHDELVFESPKDELEEITEELRRIMETALPMDVPIKVDINVGQNWLEAK